MDKFSQAITRKLFRSATSARTPSKINCPKKNSIKLKGLFKNQMKPRKLQHKKTKQDDKVVHGDLVSVTIH